MRKTVKIKLVPERPNDLLTTMSQYSLIYKLHSDWAIQNKTFSKQKAHFALYNNCRSQFPSFPSAFIQCARDNALESVKATKFKRKINPKKLATIRYDARTCTLRGHQLTLSSIGKRQKTILNIPKYFQTVFSTWKFTGCQLSHHKNTFWICLNFETDTPPKQEGKVLGIDRGQYNLVATSQGELYLAKEIRKNKRKHLYNRKTLQAKGTRSSVRRLRKLSGKEKRFSKQVNHVVSKWLVNKDATVFVLEKLSKIKQRKGKHCNKRNSDWSFYQLEHFLKYKAETVGKSVEYVDAHYTSQKCNCCGYTFKKNRSKNKFKCLRCGYGGHADVVAAKNIRDNYILLTQVGKAGLSQQPICSS